MFNFQDPIVRVNNYIKHRLEREMELYNLIEKSPSGALSEEEIVNEMYKASLNLYSYFLLCYYMNHKLYLYIIYFHFIQVIPNDYKKVASYIVKNHLAKLENDGKLVLIDNKWKINQQ